MSGFEIIFTKDGSHSLQHVALKETFHSRHGAIQESNYVFLNRGLSYFLERSNKRPIRIFEVGFGTGLNALLTAKFATERNLPIQYTSIEAYPLPHEIVEQLNYPSLVEWNAAVGFFQDLHSCTWGEPIALSTNFNLLKINLKLEAWLPDKDQFDVIYFDAFAPSKQPELWSYDQLENVVETMSHEGVFVTYSARGQLKRDLRSMGLIVETLEGPPGKKEMVRATRA